VLLNVNVEQGGVDGVERSKEIAQDGGGRGIGAILRQRIDISSAS